MEEWSLPARRERVRLENGMELRLLSALEILQARREAEGILRKANEQASELVEKEEIYKEAKKRSEELVAQTQERINQLRKAGNEYMEESLRHTEEAISKALHEVQDTRMKFVAVTESQEQQRKAMPNVDVDM